MHVHWSSFVAAAIGALAGVALIAYFSRRDALQRAHRPLDRSSLAGAVAAGMAQLEAEPDPRLAVIRCYAAMEGSLGEEGVPRAAAETPLEYLRRLLSQLEVGGDAASRLTPLFERAKFSREEIDETMRREALEAVRALNEELAR